MPNYSNVSKWERILYERLYKEEFRPSPQFEVEKYSLDLALFKEGRKLNIEVDGERYNRNLDG